MYASEGYRAFRTSSAFVRRGDQGVLSVTGPDRLVWLQGLLTNDVAALAPGAGCYSAYLTPQGRMVTDLRVVNLAERTLLQVPATLAEALGAKLESLLFAEDAQIVDVSSQVAVIDVRGPQALAVVGATRERAAGALLATLDDDSDGVPGVTMFIEAGMADTVAHQLASHGSLETTLETLDVLRIEAGRPVFLIDMDEHTIPLEAGIEKRAVSFTKGCYVGQEVIIRVMQRGQGRVAKKLVGLLFPKDATPHVGDLVRTDDRDIGRLTSVTRSPALERPIALGYVHREFVDAGTAVQVATRQGIIPATIAPLPFVAPKTPDK